MSEPLVIVEERRVLRAWVSPGEAVSAGSPRALGEALSRVGEGAVWVARATPLVRWAAGLVPGTRRRHRLLLLGEAPPSERAFLGTFFRDIVAPEGGVRLLPLPALMRVLASERRRDLLVGAAVVSRGRVVVVYRGSLEPLVVPYAWFASRPEGPRPDFGDVEVIDHGQTLRLGAYEAATDALLYERRRRRSSSRTCPAVSLPRKFGVTASARRSNRARVADSRRSAAASSCPS